MVRPSSLGGVPVFSRRSAKPARSRLCARRTAGASPTRPAGQRSSPRWISPRRKVPVVSTTARARQVRPSDVMTPAVLPPSRIRSSTAQASIPRLSCSASRSRIAARYSARSAWARGPRTAGPLLRLSTRNWMPARSIARPMMPSRASISRTRWPRPRPPIAGLHDIAPMVSSLWVSSSVRAPIRALAAAASQPAWPAPMITTSKLGSRLVMAAVVGSRDRPVNGRPTWTQARKHRSVWRGYEQKKRARSWLRAREGPERTAWLDLELPAGVQHHVVAAVLLV